MEISFIIVVGAYDAKFSGLNPIGDIAFSDIRYAQLFKCFLKTYNIKNGMYQFTLQKSIQNKISLYKTISKFK